MNALATLIVIEKHARNQDVFIEGKLFKGIKSNYWGSLFEKFQWLMVLGYFALIYFSWDSMLFLNVCITGNASQCLHLAVLFTALFFFGLFFVLLLCQSLLFLNHKQRLRIWFVKLFIINFGRFLNLICRGFTFLKHRLLDSFNGTEHKLTLGFVSNFLFLMIDERIEPVLNHVLCSFF